MQYPNRFALFVASFVALLSLISCTAKTSVAEPVLTSTNTPLAETVLTEVASPAPTAVIPIITPSPTKNPFSIIDGRIAFSDGSIKIFDAKNNEVKQLVESEQEVEGITISLYSPPIAWSPDGHWIAFVGTDVRANVWRYGYYDIYIARFDGSYVRRLTYSPSSVKSSLAWSPDGKYILVSMAGQTGNSDLYLIDSINGEIYRRLTASVDSGVYGGIWSPDGKSIAFTSGKSLFIMDADGKNQRLVKDFSPETPVDLSWSRDGSTIALSVNVNKENIPVYSNLFTIKPDGTDLQQITDSQHLKNSPSWSLDGEHLIFSYAPYTYGTQVTRWDAYIRDNYGHEQKILSNLDRNASIVWSPVPALQIGSSYTITELSNNLNVHSSALLASEVLEKLINGNVFVVLEGPVDADDYYWWKIRTQNGAEGWIVEMANWYKPLTE